MKTIPRACVLAVSLLGVAASHAIPITEATRFFAVGANIADLQNPPVTFRQTITDSAIVSLSKVEVGLRLVGSPVGSGFASEMFVSLNQDLSTTSILLNRVGLSSRDPIGAFYDGWDVTFSDSAANGDVHLASLLDGVLTGAWAPDGRVLPENGARPMMLSQFNGSQGNGDWYLSVADLGIGGTMRLESWSLTLSGDNGAAIVPEGKSPSIWFAAVAAAFAWVARKRAVRNSEITESSPRYTGERL